MKNIETNHLSTIAIVAISAIVLATMIYFVDLHIKDKVKQQFKNELALELSSSKKQLSDFIEQHRRNLHFLHETPPISGLSRSQQNKGIDPFDNTSFEQWLKRLETIFIAKLKNQQDIDQLRILNAEGLELLRVDRLSGRIEAHPSFDLQDKSQASYFKNAQSLFRNQYLISSISLNREHGEIEYPYRPTMRFIAPIFNDDNSVFGYLIINVNPLDAISNLDIGDNNQVAISILNSKRQIIWHPEESLRYAADLTPSIIWPTPQPIDDASLLPTVQWQQNTLIQLQDTVLISTGKHKESLIILATRPMSALNTAIMSERMVSYSLIIVIVFVASVIIAALMVQTRNRLKYAKSQSIFSAIINGSQDVILSLDSNGKVTSWNKAAVRVFELTDKQAIGQTFSQILQRDKQLWTSKIRQVMSEGQTIQEEVSLIVMDKPREFVMTVAPAKNVDKTTGQDVLGVAVILRDVTEEKVAQKAIVDMNESLEKQVAGRTEELAIAHKEAVKASEIKSAFVSNISHEMRTPLNGIIGMMNLVAREKLSSRQQHYLQMAENSAETLATLVNDILDLSKIEAGKLEIERKPFDLLGLLENVIASMAVRAFDKSIELILDISQLKHKSFSGDALRINQIFFNLVGNAIKFTETGHVIIQVSSYAIDSSEIELKCDVIDTGIGIAEENYDKIFAKFDQETANTAEQYGGTGLGLSIAKQLAGLMNGNITFISEKGVGSTFTLLIKYPKASALPLEIQPELQGQRALCVSPSPALNKAISRLLMQMGAKVDVKSRLDESLSSMLVEQHYDWLLLDGALAEIEKWYSKWHKESKFKGKVALLKSCIYQNFSAFEQGLVIVDKPVTLTDLSHKLNCKNNSELTDGNYKKSANGQVFEQFKKVLDNVSGIKVLAVDDNDINLEVARGFLEPLDIRLYTANNGQEALSQIRKAASNQAPFSLVLMDCQMPVMDGYQAATAIRRGDAGESAKNLPIIAMTASAMAGEREKCLAAGMNDYITKPISVTVLTEKVVEHLGYQASMYREQDKTEEISVTEQEADLTTLEDTHDLHQLELSQEPIWDIDGVMVRLMNDENLYQRLSKMFFDDLPDRFKEIEKAMDDEEINSICSTSHRLKGIAGDVGANRLHKVCSGLEWAAKDQNLEKCQSIFQILKKELNSIEKTDKYLEWQKSSSV